MTNHELTRREIEVLLLIARGLPDKEIGLALGISGLTVRNHLQNMREKVQVRNRTGLALHAIATGLAPMPQAQGVSL